MARNLIRVSPPAIVRSEFANSVIRRFMCSTAQKLGKREESDSETKEKIQVRTEDEEKSDSKTEENEAEEWVNSTGEIGGPTGPEPTRYGDWEKNGRCSDF